jgi:hypothetical protein
MRGFELERVSRKRSSKGFALLWVVLQAQGEKGVSVGGIGLSLCGNTEEKVTMRTVTHARK